MKIIIGSDHAGFDLKEKCRIYFEDKTDLEVIDAGVFSTESSDYPGIAKKVALAVLEEDFDSGILICGSGIGMSITANRFKGVRAALCHNIFTAEMSRRHNNANILVMGARVIGDGLALEMADVFLATDFDGGRHRRRLDLIDC